MTDVAGSQPGDIDDPLDLGYAVVGYDIPPSVEHRLQARAKLGCFVTAAGRPDLGALFDARLLDEGGGQISILTIRRVMDDTTDPDMQLLCKSFMRSILRRDGYPEAADAIR